MAMSTSEASSGTAPSADDILGAIDLGVLALDSNWEASFANLSWERLTGQVDGRWRGAGWQALLAAGAADAAAVLRADGAKVAAAVEVLVADGDPPRVLRLDARPIDDLTGGVVLTVRDVSEERTRTEELTRAAMHDPLTGLWNRNRFLEFLTQALASQHRHRHRSAAVFFLDIDDLKTTNDHDGHAAGDELLVSVARCLTNAVRPGDVVARYGGDEFTVLCDGVENDDEALTIAGRILDAVTDAPDVFCSVTLGMAMSRSPDDDPADVVARADADMYRLKRRVGRPRPPEPGRADGYRHPSFVVSAHELCGPLATASGFARLLRDSWTDLGPEERADALDAVARLLTGLEHTVDDVLVLGQVMERVGLPEIVSITDAIERALRASPPPAGTSVRVDVPARTCGLVMGADDVHHVLVQLLGTSYRRRPGVVVIRGDIVAAHLVLAVEDDAEPDGAGRDRVSMNGTARPGGNQREHQLGLRETGTGLALARDVVEVVGGALTHERRPMGGTIVRVRLPLVDDGATGRGAAWR